MKIEFIRMIAVLSVIIGPIAAAQSNDSASSLPEGVDRLCRKKGNGAEADCESELAPLVEVRSLSAMPISLLVIRDNGKNRISPAAGLEIGSVWFTPFRPSISKMGNVDDTKIYTSGTGFTLAIVSSAGALIQNDEKTRQLVIEGQEVPTKETAAAAYFNLSLGLLLEWTWKGGGHLNHVALGVLGRYGYLLSPLDNRDQFTWGPALVIER